MQHDGDDHRDARLRGVVTDFDDGRGLGEIRLDDTGAVFAFHCVSIADGTRTIQVGTEVSFDPLLKLGRQEAGDIRPR
jgi:cold shock CspA family protein